ncbi:diaminopimelate decarboxylase [Tetragenococcus muriaticus PMC-11-5]|uniref:Diaminopimelate decarboxylase n=2 Tax=Tetragenococcus muriaticus TaxID=64642 RepID=A0A091C6A3_9ENTE|nr:diaminopimelate decarboxylase [Tetragenococcus muriaticus 3MR10-3]KFN92958.1 diaminopimelate decarboxylase [Tetragenococcus muriaticus PMC-11-5]
MPLDESLLLPIIQQAIQSSEVNFYGIHFHIGSQLFDNSTHLKAAEVALQLAVMIKGKFNYEIKELNYGGGFGVRYTEDDKRQSYAYFLDPLMALTEDFCVQNGLNRPTIAIEPGRSIVAEAGISLHTIGSIKTLPGIRKYAAIDGGMTDNIRPGLYQATYTGMLANKAAQALDETVTISGKACESTDILIENIQVPTIASGDIFATFTTGAYGYAMANNYNKLAIPAVVLVNKGKADIIVKRQTYEQIIQNERIPESLK